MGFTSSSSPSNVSTTSQQITRATSTEGDNSPAIQTGGAGNVTVYDPKAALFGIESMGTLAVAALEKMLSGNSKAIDALAGVTSQEISNSAAQRGRDTDMVRELAVNTQTGGQATTNKTVENTVNKVVYAIIAIAVAAVAALFFRKRQTA